jgi:hypothetical protein
VWGIAPAPHFLDFISLKKAVPKSCTSIDRSKQMNAEVLEHNSIQARNSGAKFRCKIQGAGFKQAMQSDRRTDRD